MGRLEGDGHRRVPARAVASWRRERGRRLEGWFGGPARTRVILVLGGVLALSSADTATVGASARPLRHALHISQLRHRPAGGVNSRGGGGRQPAVRGARRPDAAYDDSRAVHRAVGRLHGVERDRRAFGHLIARPAALGVVTASAGPVMASMLGDWFPSAERGRIYSYVLTGELVGGGVGFAVTGDVSALSWRLAFLLLAVPAFVLAWWSSAARADPRRPRRDRAGRADIPRRPDVVVRDAVDRRPPPRPDENVAQRRVTRAGRRAGPGAGAEIDARIMGLAGDPLHPVDPHQRRDDHRQRLRLLLSGRACRPSAPSSSTSSTGSTRRSRTCCMLVVGVGAVVGVLVGGRIGDALLRRGFLNWPDHGRRVAAAIAAVVFIPALRHPPGAARVART